MKPRKTKDLKSLAIEELNQLLIDTQETVVKQSFQHSLKQLHDTAYLKILRQDIARMQTIVNERKS
ncbi:MAG: 50S ribosomal protein L29 [Candidatus Kapabacteria bacterium]|jgi:large subunit ribosomal protein L29|nr:50S ribosomal protein L29 [Candidatus Kapabacteria bacterium]